MTLIRKREPRQQPLPSLSVDCIMLWIIAFSNTELFPLKSFAIKMKKKKKKKRFIIEFHTVYISQMGQSKKFSIQLAIKFSIKGDQLFKFAERFGYPARAFSLKVFLDLQPCDVGAPSFRDVQCSGYNNWIFPEDGKLHQWSEYKLPEGNCLVNYSSYLVIKSGKWEPVINLEISKLDGALYL